MNSNTKQRARIRPQAVESFNCKYLTCIICLSLLEDPMQTPCGCRACFFCLQEYLADSQEKDCPNKKNSPDCGKISLIDSPNKVKLDPAAKRDLKRISVYCPNEDYGCSSTFQLKNLDDHLLSCNYASHACDKCNETIMKLNLNNHRQTCPMELESCKFLCFNSTLYTRKYLHEKHYNLAGDECCHKYRGCCPFCSAGDFDRVSIQNHKEECPQWQFDCAYSHVGCKVRGNKEYLSAHKADSEKLHLELASQVVGNNNRKIVQLQKDLKALNDSIIQLQSAHQHSLHLYDSCKVQFNSFRSDPTNYTRHHHLPSVIHQNGSCIFKIDDFTSKLKNAKLRNGRLWIKSDSFYTSAYGYKMCAKIFLNGDGQAENRYISFFVMIEKGEYDDILSWPFMNKVTVSLLDQNGRNQHHSHTFRPDPNSPCFTKPIYDENQASGIPCFFSQDLILNSRFIKNDSLFLKVAIQNS